MSVLAVSELTAAERDRLNADRAAQARDAGRLRLPRAPDEVLFADGLDPSDSAVVAIIEGFLAGQLERRKPKLSTLDRTRG